MCKVWILTTRGAIAVKPTDLEVGVRLRSVLDWLNASDAPKPVAKKVPPLVKPVASRASASLQSGGVLEKALEPYWGNEDTMGHYRQRCGEHNHREQVCFKTARRRQVVRY